MNLPKAKLDRDTAMQLWTNERSDYAKEQVVLTNIGIVGMVMKQLKLNTSDEYLFSTGIVGLVNAVNKYDAEKGIKFSTFATVIIKREVIRAFRKKRVDVAFSLDDTKNLGGRKEIPYADMIPDKTDIENEVISREAVNQVIDGLSGRESDIIDLIFFQEKTQMDVAEEMGISQAQVSRILKSTCKKCEKELI